MEIFEPEKKMGSFQMSPGSEKTKSWNSPPKKNKKNLKIGVGMCWELDIKEEKRDWNLPI